MERSYRFYAGYLIARINCVCIWDQPWLFDWVTKAKRNTVLFRKIYVPVLKKETLVKLSPGIFEDLLINFGLNYWKPDYGVEIFILQLQKSCLLVFHWRTAGACTTQIRVSCCGMGERRRRGL